MKIIVIGGSGLIGKKLVSKLKDLGHDAVSASPSSGVNTLTGEGLSEALKGAEVVVDVANSPSFEEKAALDFFEKSGHNLLTAEKAAGVKHHVALSVVGTERLAANGYFRGKFAQEKLIKASNIPYTIVQSTQFFEFLPSIAQEGSGTETIHLSSAFFQPIASDDVAAALVKVVLAPPLTETIEIAGPERLRLSDLVQNYLKAKKDSRKVVGDPRTPYFGYELAEDTLVPQKPHPRLASTTFEKWFESQTKGS